MEATETKKVNAPESIMVFKSNDDLCNVCEEELLKYGGPYFIGASARCWNCHNNFTMEKVSSREKDDPMGNLSTYRDKFGFVQNIEKQGKEVSNIKLAKVVANANRYTVDDVTRWLVSKGLNVPTQQEIDESRGIIIMKEKDYTPKDGYVVPLVMGIYAELEAN